MIPENIIKITKEESLFLVSSDISGKPLNGGLLYRMHLPEGMPVCSYWSVIVYDIKNGLIIKNDQLWPSVHSHCKKLDVNEDGSVDVFFGPQIPTGKECNWIQTNKGRGWYMILRLYDLEKEMSVNDWSPGALEPINQ